MGELLVGIHEIAKLARVTPAAVSNWRSRHPTFPVPEAELRSGPVFRRDRILAWLRTRRVPVTTVISTINLKGGVGKTTTTVAVAEMLAAEFGKRVLVVDLDPQTNATVMLVGEDRWRELNANGQTVARLFQSALDRDAYPPFDVVSAIQHGVGSTNQTRKLSLLASSLDLIEVQDRLAGMGSGRFHTVTPTEVLRRALRPVLEEYDYVLIDCPPSMGLVTLNGLRISHGYVIPTVPDFMSTYGIPQIVKRVRDFSEELGESIEPWGIVISKFQGNSTVHINQTRELRNNPDNPPVYDTIIYQSNQIAAAAEGAATATLRQKWGYAGQFDAYRELTKEIMAVAESGVGAS
jgi:chromosome partitioning protein